MTDTGYQAVIPMLAYEDAAAALDWLAAAFGFTEITRMVGEEGTIGHAEDGHGRWVDHDGGTISGLRESSKAPRDV